MIPVTVLLIVFILIAVRRIGSYRLQIWHIMLLGAIAVLATRQISPPDALRAINADVMLFLFGVFVIGQALEESGYLSQLSFRFFRKAGTMDSLVLLVLFGAGAASALLMNDTLAIIGTPVMLLIARTNKAGMRNSRILLLALAFGVTIGSVTSPIGNPQNLLIAVGGAIPNPFISFFRFLFLPTVVNLFLAYLLLRLFFRRDFRARVVVATPEPVADPALARLSQAALLILLALVAVKIVLVSAGSGIEIRLTYIALAAAAPILAFSRKRLGIARRIDWSTLVFFAAMFILMASVWNSGFFQARLAGLPGSAKDISSTGAILGVSIVLSQFISNVPLVALYLPMLAQAGAGVKGMLMLAAGSTIAGNLTVLGAASNVIIIQNAEKRGDHALSWLHFARIGVPLTALNAAVYWLFGLLF